MANAKKSIRPIVVGANHRSSGLSLRDRLFVEDAAAGYLLSRLREAGLAEAMLLSTCDRVEVHAAHAETEQAADVAVRLLAEHAGMAPDELRPSVYLHVGDEAVRHLFRVAASLDSAVVGEPQVLGQVKAAHRLAGEAGTLGSALENLLQAAYSAAKRARSETAIGERPVSIAAAAVRLARDLHGDLARTAVLLIGAGDMGELVVGELLAGGAGRITVADPIEGRARTLAGRLDCHVAAFEDLAAAMPGADIIVSAVGGRRNTLTADMVRLGLAARRRRPQFIVDAAVPGDVEPSVNRLDDAFLYDLSDLERVAMEGMASREAAAAAAEAIVAEEAEAFLRGRAARDAVPLVTALRDLVEEERARALAEAGGDAEKATRLLVNRLLHRPTTAMKEAAADGPAWAEGERWARRLFGLDEEIDDPEDGK